MTAAAQDGAWATQRLAPYVDALRAYVDRTPARLNVPGHKGGRGADPGLRDLLGPQTFAIDVPPLLPGIDAGPQPTPRDQAERLAALAYGAARTWFLTNGASQANQVIALALATCGSTVVIGRNAHSSSIDGLVLSGLRPAFVMPEMDPDLGIAHLVRPEELADALDHEPDAVAAIVVSPTYFGACADVAALASVAHDRGVPLVVDESWGGHFGFHPSLPRSALQAGADLVVSSTHKMVGSLTQSAMLHAGDGPWRDVLEAAVDRVLAMVESTSVSSLLLASLDGARRQAATRGRRILDAALDVAAQARTAIAKLDGFRVVDLRACDSVVGVDPLRIVVDVRATGHTGLEIAARLRATDGVDVELASHQAVVAVLGMGEPGEEAVRRLVNGLAEIKRVTVHAETTWPSPPGTPDRALTPREAFASPTEIVPARQAAGRVSADALAAYPPGIPTLIPGEVISAAAVEFLQSVAGQGGWVRGALDPAVARLRVVDDLPR